MNIFDQIRAAFGGKPEASKQKLSNAWNNRVPDRTHQQGVGFHPVTGAPVYNVGGLQYDAATGRPLQNFGATQGPAVPPRLQAKPGQRRADGKIFVNPDLGYQSPQTIAANGLMPTPDLNSGMTGSNWPAGVPKPGPKPGDVRADGKIFVNPGLGFQSPTTVRSNQLLGSEVAPSAFEPQRQGPAVPPRLQQPAKTPDLNAGMGGANWPAGVPAPGTPVDPSTWTNIKASVDPAAPKLNAPTTNPPAARGPQTSAPAGVPAAPPQPAMSGSALPPGTTPQVIRTPDGIPDAQPVQGFAETASSPASDQVTAPAPVSVTPEVPTSDPAADAAQKLLGQTVQALTGGQQPLSMQEQIQLQRLGYVSGRGNI